MKSFLAMLSFFTRIPVRARFEIDNALFQKGIKYLIVIGLMIGGVLSFVFMLGTWIGRPVAAFVSLAAYLFLSGGLHVDGMADTMDAFGSNRDREKMLAIMKDSRIGTFGVLAVCVYVVGMTLFLWGADIVAVLLFPLVGRTAALLCAKIFNYARESGTGKAFVDGARTIHVIAALAAYLVIAWLFCFNFSSMAIDIRDAAALLLPYIISLAVVTIIVGRMSKKLAGITGDVIGFSIEATQFVYLLVSCVIIGLW